MIALVLFAGALWFLAAAAVTVLAMSIPAGLPQPRPDQQYQTSGAAMAPGSQTPVVRARQVIISGTGTVTGLFVYSGTPGPGNPPVVSITRSSTDPFGNAVDSDVVAYGSGGAFAQLTSGELNFMGTSGQASPAQVRTENIAGFLDLISGQVGFGDAQAELTLQSASASGVGQSQILLNAGQIGGILNIPNTTPAGPAAAPSSYTQAWGQNITGVLNTLIAKGGQIGLWP